MSLNGTQLMPRLVAHLAHHAGWLDHDLLIAVAVCSAESSRYTMAENDQNPDGSIDRGLWQINSVHLGQVIAGGPVTVERLFDPHQNVRIAYALWQAAGWGAWAAYTSGAYASSAYIGPAAVGIKNYWLMRYAIPIPTAEKAG